MAPRGVRGSADARREDVLAAAQLEFASGGLVGTSTDVIARRAGISQPYLFRLFPTKKALFLAAVERTFAQVEQAFRDAAESRTGDDAKVAMSVAYERLLAERTFRRMQVQAYATSVDDAEVRELTRRMFSQLWESVMVLGGMSEEVAHAFFAHGMLLTVTAALGIGSAEPSCDTCGPDDDALARRMSAEPAFLHALLDPAPHLA